MHIEVSTASYRVVTDSRGGSVALDNKIAWMPSAAQKTIIAIGGAQQWSSRQPLPPDAVLADLVHASQHSGGEHALAHGGGRGGQVNDWTAGSGAHDPLAGAPRSAAVG